MNRSSIRIGWALPLFVLLAAAHAVCWVNSSTNCPGSITWSGMTCGLYGPPYQWYPMPSSAATGFNCLIDDGIPHCVYLCTDGSRKKLYTGVTVNLNSLCP